MKDKLIFEQLNKEKKEMDKKEIINWFETEPNLFNTNEEKKLKAKRIRSKTFLGFLGGIIATSIIDNVFQTDISDTLVELGGIGMMVDKEIDLIGTIVEGQSKENNIKYNEEQIDEEEIKILLGLKKEQD